MQRVTLTTRQVKCTTRSTGVKEDEVNEEEGWFLFAERPVGQYQGQPWFRKEAHSRDAEAREEN
jgi:hypothetical protein